MNKLHSLTILRALAATTVIGFHAMATSGPAFGEFGVDIFFVLSGFVIALVIDTPGLTARQFLSDRIARIVPLYWLMTMTVFVGAMTLPALFNSTTADVGHLFQSLFFIPYRKESGHLFPMLFVGWTLNYEMMFYLVSALSLVLVRRKRLLFIAVAIAAIWFAAKASGSRSAIAEFVSHERVFEFPLGFAAYLLWRNGVRVRPVAAAAVVAAMNGWMAFAQWKGFADAPLLYFGGPSFLMVTGCLSLESMIGTSLLSRGAIFVGNASYATYLSHPYCVQAAHKLMPSVIDGFDAASASGIASLAIVGTALGCGLYWFADRKLHRNARLLLNGKLPLVVPLPRFVRARRTADRNPG